MIDKRSTLKQGQIDILEVLYKYRFGSRQLIAESLSIKASSSLYERLNVLIKHDLVAMRQEKRLKLLGVPASYFLTPKGLRTLQAIDHHEYINESIIKASYRDKILSQTFVSHTLDVFKYTNILKLQYPKLKVYLRRNMSRFSYFPKTPPDAFLSLAHDNITKRYFFDYISASLERKVLFQRIYSYIDFFDNDGWDVTGTEIPILLFVAENATMERRIRRIAKGVINKIEIDDEIIIYTTTKKALEAPNKEITVWSDLEEPDELISLF